MSGHASEIMSGHASKKIVFFGDLVQCFVTRPFLWLVWGRLRLRRDHRGRRVAGPLPSFFVLRVLFI